MVKRVNLRTKINSLGEPCFAFEDIIPNFDKELDINIINKAKNAWKEFLSGKTQSIPYDLIPTLVLIEEEVNAIEKDSYSKLLNYVFNNSIYSDRIVKNLFFKLHQYWNYGKYFHQLFSLRDLIHNHNTKDKLINNWKNYSKYLLTEQAPVLCAKEFSQLNKWTNKPRNNERIKELNSCIETFTTNCYGKDLKSILIKENGYEFIYLFALNLFKLAYSSMTLTDNFTKDFVFNIKNLDDQELADSCMCGRRIYKNVLTRDNLLSELKQNLYPTYETQLINQYKKHITITKCSKEFLDNIENIIEEIYNLYPINYKETEKDNLPEYNFISNVVLKLVERHFPSGLCDKFTQDLRLCKNYPAYDKILEDIIAKNKTNWQTNNQEIKQQYLTQIYEKFIPNLSNYKWDEEFLDLLSTIQQSFYTTFCTEEEKELYNEFLNRLFEKILATANNNVSLRECEDFESDIRLKDVQSVNIPDFIKSKILQQNYDKVSVIVDYICAFADKDYFNYPNDLSDKIYERAQKYNNTILSRRTSETKYIKAVYWLNQYQTIKNIHTVTENDTTTERRVFWLNLQKLNTISNPDLFRIEPLIEYSIALIKYDQTLIIESFDYGKALYYDVDYFRKNVYTSFERTCQAIEGIIRRKKYSHYSDLRPKHIAEELHFYNFIWHRGRWTDKVRDLLR